MGGTNGPGGQIFNIGKSKAKIFNKEDVDIKIKKIVFDYDQLIIMGPAFPHEVVGFSGCNVIP